MSVQDATVKAFEAIGVFEIGQDWADLVWASNFADNLDLPEMFLESLNWKLHSDILGETARICREWMGFDIEVTDEESLWALLQRHDIKIHIILPVLAAFMKDCCKQTDILQITCAFYAADIYLSLLGIPGSGAFNVFESVVFQKAFDVCLLWKGRNKMGKKKATGRGANKRARTNSGTGSSSLQDDDVNDTLSLEDVSQIQPLICRFIKHACTVLESYSLQHSTESLDHAFQSFAFVFRNEAVAEFPNYKENNSFLHARHGAVLASLGLKSLCSGTHGDVNQSHKLLIKHLMPALLMLQGENVQFAQTIPADASRIRIHAEALLQSFISKENSQFNSASISWLLENLAFLMPDKADYRGKLAPTIAQFCNLVPDEENSSFFQWLFLLGYNEKPFLRGIVVDICSSLLSIFVYPERDDPEGIYLYLTRHFHVSLILERCRDSAATVRARALLSLGLVLKSSDVFVNNAGKETLTKGTLDALPATPSDVLTEAHGGLDRVIEMIKNRIADEKSGVRKAAIVVMETMLCFKTDLPTDDDLGIFSDCCRDAALSVRKQAVGSVSEILRSLPNNEKVHRLFLHSILPMVLDPEASVVNYVLSILEDVILGHIASPESRTEGSPANILCWKLLNYLASAHGQEMSTYLQKTCNMWAKNEEKAMQQGKNDNVISIKNIVKHLSLHVDVPEHSNAAWMLLGYLTRYSPDKPGQQLVLKYWNLVTGETKASNTTVQDILTVCGHCAGIYHNNLRDKFVESLTTMLSGFCFPVEVISQATTTLCSLIRASSGVDLSLATEDQVSFRSDAVESICQTILQSSHKEMRKVVFSDDDISCSQEEVNNRKLVRQLFTIGEMAQRCPQRLSRRIPLLVQSLLLSAEDTEAGNINLSADIVSQTPISGGDAGSQGPTPIGRTPADLGRTPLNGRLPPEIRAHAFIALGKLCLQNEDLAKKCIAVLARELETSKDAIIRNNVCVILCDLCVRYTLLVDHYVPVIATCLKDPKSFVRKQTLTLLTHLLQEDYIKWKGPLFFRFIVTIADDEEEIRKFADFCMTNILYKRNPLIFSNHFIESIFVFNSYVGYEAFNSFEQSPREKELFNLAGNESVTIRAKLYSFMLENMSDLQKFLIALNISLRIFKPVVDCVIPLNDKSYELLADCFRILSCKAIKFKGGSKKSTDDDVEDLDVLENEAVVISVVSANNRKKFIENILGNLVEMKKMLQDRRAPMVKNLMECLQDLVQNDFYKTEIEDWGTAHRDVMVEIMFEIHRLDPAADAVRRASNAAGTQPRNATGTQPRNATGTQPRNATGTQPRNSVTNQESAPQLPGTSRDAAVLLPMADDPMSDSSSEEEDIVRRVSVALQRVMETPDGRRLGRDVSTPIAGRRAIGTANFSLDLSAIQSVTSSISLPSPVVAATGSARRAARHTARPIKQEPSR